ncbi:primase-helicase zinc-binding domain-containing protein [Salmonella enterica]|uniref:primase-helicase zinc-binding domain-containing protein n=1 Tax=Salmonella enterica TaxID=28901 RepID=UPI003D7978A7
MKVIKNRHQSCPVCGGSDRFRFDDKEGRGTWFCNQCGAGDGLKLVEKVFGVSASEAAGKVNAVTGNLPPVAPEVIAAAEAETEADRKAAAARPRWPSGLWIKPDRPPATPTSPARVSQRWNV